MNITAWLHGLWKDQAGAQAVEWPLVAALLALGAIAAWTILGGGLSTALGNLGTLLGDTAASANSL